MRITWLGGRIPAVLAAGLIVAGGLAAGCSDDGGGDTGTGTGSQKITVEEIIFNPKSPGPGDTLRATAVVTSANPFGGAFVEYTWSASGGTLLENDRSSVRWMAPSESAIYSLSVSASNDANTSTMSDDVFVCRKDLFIAERAGTLHPLPSGDGVYYTSPPATEFDGLVIRLTDGTTDEAPFGTSNQGTQFSFDMNATLAAQTFVELSFPPKTTVVYFDLVTETRTTLARDPRPFPARPNPFERPSVSHNGQFIAFQGGLFDQTAPPSQGGTDTFAVFIFDVQGQSTQRATFKGHPDKPNVSNSFFPSVSSDHQHLVFVSGRTGPFDYEFYALPIVGNTVTADTVPGALVKLSDTDGAMATGTTIPPAPVTTQWNPGSTPILAAIGGDAKLRLVPTDGSGAIFVAAPGDVSDMSWRPDGQYLAMVAAVEGEYTIYRVSAGGVVDPLIAGAAGDRLGRLSWSPDGEFLVYSLTRGTTTWYEVLDAGGSTGVTEPVRITPALPTGDAINFGPPLQVLRPAWRPGTATAYVFYLDGETPRVFSIDVSGIGD